MAENLNIAKKLRKKLIWERRHMHKYKLKLRHRQSKRILDLLIQFGLGAGELVTKEVIQGQSKWLVC